MESLEWTGKKGYNAAQLVDWDVDGKVAGSYKTSGNLTVRLQAYTQADLFPSS